MSGISRRQFLAGSGVAGLAMAYPQIVKALSIPARVKSGTIEDVEHVVILMQENRSFDHYFGTMPGVRGFSDPYPAPVKPLETMAERNVFTQLNTSQAGPRLISPFALNTRQTFAHMRVEGTPHSWTDAQFAWDHGRMDQWPDAKHMHAMGYFEQQDIPFQFALADAFTLCDAYHCSMHAGTNPNRLYLWTGCNDGHAQFGGPAVGNSHDNLPERGGPQDAYHWTTYPERLQAAGIDWTIYQDMGDNFTDNPLVGFKAYRDAYTKREGADAELLKRALSTRALDRLKEDVLADKLPAVSYVIATAEGSEHPGPSSPAQGAAYTADMLDALTANPDVWAKTVLFIMFDENDGFFDHMPPPAPPSPDTTVEGGFAGHSQISTSGEYHLHADKANTKLDRPELRGRPYGLGPRVPAYVVSPWSRGGYVCSEVMDHTSVIRFLETRFGVMEPNISPWRRAVCGDFLSAFDFANPNKASFPHLPAPYQDALRAAEFKERTVPPIPSELSEIAQLPGHKPHRPCLYDLNADCSVKDGKVVVQMQNLSQRAVVLQVYDRLNLTAIPKRYTLAAKGRLRAEWPLQQGHYDLQLMGPEGFHRRFKGLQDDTASASLERTRQGLQLVNQGQELRYRQGQEVDVKLLGKGQSLSLHLDADRGYDLKVDAPNGQFVRQFAGRLPA
ncbi:phosphocholine-specific phospholipase C [Bowmanella pacifica]|uniref:phospholipase C n=1 Tax=Bowmanella pacifica TaxID=502051 RepID=A0A917YST1_9ALTE|nr:phospholipase C, phosphocholine-specific [Bowmanella pacifica]GGO64979.1 phospholipase C [Bowmanella pacifica]